MCWKQQFDKEQAVLGLLGLNSNGISRDMDFGITVVDRERSLRGENSQTAAWRLWRIADVLPEPDVPAWAVLQFCQINPDDHLHMIHDLMQQNGTDPCRWAPTGPRWCFPL